MNTPHPKQARAVATRARLITAALSCLTSHGYAGASTTRIASRAGVSQGALFRHFPVKTQLLAAATEALFEEMRGDFVEKLATLPADTDLLAAGCDTLWTYYTDPRLLGVFELYLAARTDETLAEVLQPVVQAHFEAIVQIARLLFPQSAPTPAFDATIHAVILVFQGAGLMTRAHPGTHDLLQRDLVVRMVRRELGEPEIPPTEAP